jgi:hypothetical protein
VKLLKLKHCSDHSKSLGPIDEAGHLDKAAKEIQSNSNVEILTLLDVFASPQTNLAARRYPLAVDDYVQFSRRIPQITHMRTAQRLEFTIPSRRCGDRTNRERFDMTISPKVFAEHEADHTLKKINLPWVCTNTLGRLLPKLLSPSIHSFIHSHTRFAISLSRCLSLPSALSRCSVPPLWRSNMLETTFLDLFPREVALRFPTSRSATRLAPTITLRSSTTTLLAAMDSEFSRPTFRERLS